MQLPYPNKISNLPFVISDSPRANSYTAKMIKPGFAMENDNFGPRGKFEKMKSRGGNGNFVESWPMDATAKGW